MIGRQYRLLYAVGRVPLVARSTLHVCAAHCWVQDLHRTVAARLRAIRHLSSLGGELRNSGVMEHGGSIELTAELGTKHMMAARSHLAGSSTNDKELSADIKRCGRRMRWPQQGAGRDKELAVTKSWRRQRAELATRKCWRQRVLAVRKSC